MWDMAKSGQLLILPVETGWKVNGVVVIKEGLRSTASYPLNGANPF